jgi:hypothetical protein
MRTAVRHLPLIAVLAAAAGGQTVNVDYGIGNAQMVPGSSANPFSTTYGVAYYHQVIPASALTAAGVPSGARLASTWIISDASVGMTFPSVAISAVNYPTDYLVDIVPYGVFPLIELTPVRAAAPFTDVPGWNVLDATNEFYWDGSSSVGIEFAVLNGHLATGGSGGPNVRGTAYPAIGSIGIGTNGYRGALYSGPPGSAQTTSSLATDTVFDMRLVFTTAPLNDLCAQATPVTDGTYAGTHVGATWSFAELPGPWSSAPLKDEVWYSYVNTTPSPRSVEFSVCGSAGYDTFVAAYTGPCWAPTYVAHDDDACGTVGGPSKLTFVAQPGVTYRVAVGQWTYTYQSAAPFTLAVSSAGLASTGVVGPGCGGAVPATLSGTTPTLGTVGTITVSGAPPISVVILLLGTPSPSSLFLDSGCPLHLDPWALSIYQIGVADLAGQWSLSQTLPNVSALAGISVALQAVVVATNVAPTLRTTNALQLNFGF